MGITGPDDEMTDTSNQPTSSAADPEAELEILAGISSAEGQPDARKFANGAINPVPGLMVCGAVAVLGLAAGLAYHFGRPVTWLRPTS
jgi:hypothetical protein